MGPWHENSFMVTTGIAAGAPLRANHATRIPFSLLSRHMQLVGQHKISIVAVGSKGERSMESSMDSAATSSTDEQTVSKSTKKERSPRRRKK